MLLQSLLSLVELPKEYKQLLLNNTKDIQSMIIQSYSNPSLENVVAITLIAGEYLYTKNYSLANIYLGQAVRMAGMLQIIPKETEKEKNIFLITNNRNQDSLKEKLWEFIIILHVGLSYLPGSFLTLKYT
ncbi:hypothetical protein K502DRAFT_325625, partial [Neoconidiobolus thromboides FSU 785]